MWLRSEATPKDCVRICQLNCCYGRAISQQLLFRAMRHAGVFGKAVGVSLHIKASILFLFQAKLRTSSLLGLILLCSVFIPRGCSQSCLSSSLLLVPCVQKQHYQVETGRSDLIGIEENAVQVPGFLCWTKNHLKLEDSGQRKNGLLKMTKGHKTLQ